MNASQARLLGHSTATPLRIVFTPLGTCHNFKVGRCLTMAEQSGGIDPTLRANSNSLVINESRQRRAYMSAAE